MEHLARKGSITPAEALVAYSCMRLAGRIYDLREQGHNIQTQMKTDSVGTRYASYHLVK